MSGHHGLLGLSPKAFRPLCTLGRRGAAPQTAAGSDASSGARRQRRRSRRVCPPPCDHRAGLLLALFLLGLVFYIWMILRDPEAIERWVSTTVIFLGHTQTISILGLLQVAIPPPLSPRPSGRHCFCLPSHLPIRSGWQPPHNSGVPPPWLQLGWPRAAEAVTDTLALDLVNLGGTKPECFLQVTTPRPPPPRGPSSGLPGNSPSVPPP